MHTSLPRITLKNSSTQSWESKEANYALYHDAQGLLVRLYSENVNSWNKVKKCVLLTKYALNSLSITLRCIFIISYALEMAKYHVKLLFYFSVFGLYRMHKSQIQESEISVSKKVKSCIERPLWKENYFAETMFPLKWRVH